MIPFKKILFPVDYSALCKEIVPHVEQMLTHFSAQLTLVRAYTNTGGLAEVPELEQRQLQEFIAQQFPHRHVDGLYQEGETGRVIDDVIRHQGTDLVMMPTHGKLPRRRFLVGSVTAKVLHDVSAAVWTGVGQAIEKKPREVAYKKILCAVDFSEDIEAVLRGAHEMASSYGAQLLLVHVGEAPSRKKDGEESDTDHLIRWKQTLGIDAPHKMLTGRVADVVATEAAQENADLVVIGRGQIQGMISRIWSHVYEIVRESPCPVLSI
jgi:nucleotide-binding universal stress UspA family protein